ncbi:MAG: hypothetical protein IJL03_05220 [Lachnospiraceae bacterium]|nr:hypothetical protein [Lachnospiraceae bacterium]
MNNQNEILQKQNDRKMLECQFAARHFYNTAERCSIIAFSCAIVSLSAVFLPKGASSAYSTATYIIPLLLDAISIVYYWRMEVSVSSAAILRNYFDEIVLGLKTATNSNNDICRIKRLIIDATKKNEKEWKVQVTNTGKDTPPGVKDWYQFSQQYTKSDAVFECQKQNCMWNRALSRRRVRNSVVALLLCIILCFICGYLFHVSIPRIILCLFSAILTLSNRLIENIKYIRLSIKIDDICEMLEVSKNNVHIFSLQKLICQRRELNVVESNRIHRKHSKSLSEMYEQITQQDD